MERYVAATALTVVMIACSGCTGGGAPPVAPRADVSGTVNLDGKPMDEPNGEISFSIAGQAPVTLPIKGGKFEGQGPVGETRVEIRAWRDGERPVMDGKPFGDPVKENYVADQFNVTSSLTANIPAAGARDLKFDVESKK